MSLLTLVVTQLTEGSLLEKVLVRVLRLVFWVLVFTPLVLVPIYFLGLSL